MSESNIKENNKSGIRIKLNVMEWLTLMMVIVTGFSTVATMRMTTVTRNAYIADNRPYLAFNGLDIKIVNDTNSENADLRISLQLQNLGKSILNYKVTNLKITLDNEKNSISSKYDSANGYGALFPGQSGGYNCQVISGVNITKNVMGDLEYDIEYTSSEIEDTKYTSHKKAKITIYPNGESEVEFTEVDEK